MSDGAGRVRGSAPEAGPAQACSVELLRACAGDTSGTLRQAAASGACPADCESHRGGRRSQADLDLAAGDTGAAGAARGAGRVLGRIIHGSREPDRTPWQVRCTGESRIERSAGRTGDDMTGQKRLYFFGDGKADGTAAMKDLLGGKGANLAEMTNLGLPVPPGFTLTTAVCAEFLSHGGVRPAGLEEEIDEALEWMDGVIGARFGDPANPLLVSVRSGARRSMPGMMETVLNVGLTSRTLPGLISRTSNPRFALDAYRRLMMMYADVVMEKGEGIEPDEGEGVVARLARELGEVKRRRGVLEDTDLTAEDLERLIGEFHRIIRKTLGRPFPDDPREQLLGAIGAVFRSWNGKRAVAYRRIEGIPDEWGTALTVQAMVFGNTGDRSATGVAFTRNPATGENLLYGEWLPNAQGEDVVAGIRTPRPLSRSGSLTGGDRRGRGGKPRRSSSAPRRRPARQPELPALDEAMPEPYRHLVEIRCRLERPF